MKENLIQAKENEILKTVNDEPINSNSHSITSMEVAEMVEKEHKYLMRSIREYSEVLTGEKISPVDFWQESNYKDVKGETRPCYLITKKGCDFIAHKTPGKKGTIFTARYINRFEEMEKRLREPQANERKTESIDNRLEIARLIIRAPEDRVYFIRELYPEYFSFQSYPGSLEYTSDLNTSYTRWKDDCGVSKDWLGYLPTTDIYYSYVRYCNDNHVMNMGKKTFYKALENDFCLTKRQKSGGKWYFMSA